MPCLPSSAMSPAMQHLLLYTSWTAPWTKARHFGPNTCTIYALMAQVLAADMLAKDLMPTDMVLLYAWAGEAGCRGLQLKAVSASL